MPPIASMEEVIRAENTAHGYLEARATQLITSQQIFSTYICMYLAELIKLVIAGRFAHTQQAFINYVANSMYVLKITSSIIIL